MVWIYGASGHGKVIADILELNNIPVAGFIDDNESIHHFMDYRVIRQQELTDAKPAVILGIGDNAIRKKLAVSLPASYPVVIHPSAVISNHTTIDDGSVIMAHSVIQPGCVIGKHVIVNTSASIEHDCQLGNFVHVSPGAVLCGNVTVGEGTWIGAGTTII